jgi:hypothetical protein
VQPVGEPPHLGERLAVGGQGQLGQLVPAGGQVAVGGARPPQRVVAEQLGGLVEEVGVEAAQVPAARPDRLDVLVDRDAGVEQAAPVGEDPRPGLGVAPVGEQPRPLAERRQRERVGRPGEVLDLLGQALPTAVRSASRSSSAAGASSSSSRCR